jgi:hypothetical protein
MGYTYCGVELQGRSARSIVAGLLERVPDRLRRHLARIARRCGLGFASGEALAAAWLEKKGSFEEQVRRLSMEEVERVDPADERGFLVMTYSGSLIKVGPLVEGARRVEYTSLGPRTDVPESAATADGALAREVKVGAVVSLLRGPIRSSSPAFKIAVFTNPLGAAEQEERLSVLLRTLAREFAQVNNSLPKRGGGARA